MSRSNPRVFTEQGTAMLATILHTEVATEISIKIMDAFVMARRYLSNNLIEQKYINQLVIKHDEKISLLEQTLSNFNENGNHLFYKGQIYDAHSLLKDILTKSKKEIIIIDNYIDKNILDILSSTDKDVLLISNKYNNYDYTKYQEQYHNVNLIINNDFHDRFIIIDGEILYHCGASFKDLGKKCFSINKIEDQLFLEQLLALIKKYKPNL